MQGTCLQLQVATKAGGPLGILYQVAHQDDADDCQQSGDGRRIQVGAGLGGPTWANRYHEHASGATPREAVTLRRRLACGL
jgi:hypothetical protein